jgi:hypothetical protein
MGFRVSCSGANFIKRLTRDADSFFDAPYALYIVGLATVADDEALDWFLKYEMALDSLAGPYAAFVLFYNEARLRATSGPMRYDDLSAASEFPVPYRVLRGGAVAVNHFVRYGTRRKISSEAFVTSMTYESDSVARELGILDKLPCIVLFDDPSSEEFYLLPLRDRTDTAFVETRQLLSAFFQDPDYARYFAALREWHDLRKHLTSLEARKKNLMREFNYLIERDEALRIRTQSGLHKAVELLAAGDAKGFRIELHGASGKNVSKLPWKELRRDSNIIASAVTLIGQLRQADEPNSCVHEPGEVDRAISRACGILQYYGQPYGLPDGRPLVEMLKSFVDSAVVKVRQDISAVLLNFPEEPDYPWSESAKMARDLDGILREKAGMIRQMERPSLAPQIAALRRQKKRETVIHSFRISAAAVADKGPSVINAISTAVTVAHGI